MGHSAVLRLWQLRTCESRFNFRSPPPLPKTRQRHARLRVAPAIGGYVFVKLEFENDTGRRLSRMCCCARIQCDQAEVGTFVNEASVFDSTREVSGEVVVNAATILEHCFRLRTRSRGECT